MDPGDISGSSSVDCITIVPKGKMTVSNVDVHDCRTCIETNTFSAHAYGASLFVSDVTVDTCAGPGINARKVMANGVSVTNAHDVALWAEMKLLGSDITSSGNTGRGIFSVTIKASNVVADNNTFYGVESYNRMTIHGGEMLGNGSYDVIARRAKFTDVTCGRSQKIFGDPGENLGVCTND